jgi:hypothetical protein
VKDKQMDLEADVNVSLLGSRLNGVVTANVLDPGKIICVE